MTAAASTDHGKGTKPVKTRVRPDRGHQRHHRSSENKHGRPMTCGDTVIGPLTLASSVIVCRLLLSSGRVFAACLPPVSSMASALTKWLFVTLSGRCWCRTPTSHGRSQHSEEARQRHG
jgi:hypothetical protein